MVLSCNMPTIFSSLKTERDAVLPAIAKNGIAMVFAGVRLEGDRDFFLAAVAVMPNWDALYFTSASATSSWLPWRKMTAYWGTPTAASSAAVAASAAVAENGLASASAAMTRKTVLHRIIPLTGDTVATISDGLVVERTHRATRGPRRRSRQTHYVATVLLFVFTFWENFYRCCFI